MLAGIKSKKFKKGNQPPQNILTHTADISNIFVYSPIKKKAKIKEEYSVLYPATNSDSASGKSKGALLVSAIMLIKKIMAAGKKGIKKKPQLWYKIIVFKLKELVIATTGIKEKNIGNS